MAAGDGLIVMTPTSIDVTGTSGSINADGGVDFTAVTALSLNGVFTSSYDNYLIVCECLQTSGSASTWYTRMRLSGTSDSGNNYAWQFLNADSSTVSGTRLTPVGQAGLMLPSPTTRSGFYLYLYGPALAQATAQRSVTVSGNSSALIRDFAATHSLATAYDGIELTDLGGGAPITGNVRVFGYEE